MSVPEQDPFRTRTFPGATWTPCHGWTDGVTTWVDGYHDPAPTAAASWLRSPRRQLRWWRPGGFRMPWLARFTHGRVGLGRWTAAEVARCRAEGRRDALELAALLDTPPEPDRTPEGTESGEPEASKAPGRCYLDIGCFGAETVTESTWHQAAKEAWDAGDVLEVQPYPRLVHVRALIIPVDALTSDLVDTALERHHAP